PRLRRDPSTGSGDERGGGIATQAVGRGEDPPDRTLGQLRVPWGSGRAIGTMRGGDSRSGYVTPSAIVRTQTTPPVVILSPSAALRTGSTQRSRRISHLNRQPGPTFRRFHDLLRDPSTSSG